MKQTEVELLMLAITATAKTQEAFAKMLDMTRQNLNRIIREANGRGGDLPPKFVKRLNEQYDIDIFSFRRNPTKDFHSDTELQHADLALCEQNADYFSIKTLEHLMEENKDLRNRLHRCERALETAQKRGGRRSA